MDKNEKQNTVESVHELFAKYLSESNLAGLTGLFSEDAMYVPGRGRAPVYGKKSVAKELQPYLGSNGAIQTISKTIHENGRVALVRSEWKIVSDEDEHNGVALEVLEKSSDGKWRYIIDSPFGE